jgi:hypothetical protein
MTTKALLEQYRKYHLDRFLSHIRQEGRYARKKGHNLLTNLCRERDDHEKEICETLCRAQVAGRRYRLLVNLRAAAREARMIDGQQQLAATLEGTVRSAEELPQFASTLPRWMGLARGLNPYTDWTVAQVKRKPLGWVLLLGLDWYPISDLGDCHAWRRYLDPFGIERRKEPFWHNTWAWILNRRSASGNSWGTVDANEARGLMEKHHIGIIFHNVVPYLRPAGVSASDAAWFEKEVKDNRSEFVEDLEMLRGCLRESSKRIVAVCTGGVTKQVLQDAGYDPVRCWNAHPSRYFHPNQLKLEFREVLELLGVEGQGGRLRSPREAASTR